MLCLYYSGKSKFQRKAWFILAVNDKELHSLVARGRTDSRVCFEYPGYFYDSKMYSSFPGASPLENYDGVEMEMEIRIDGEKLRLPSQAR